MELIKRAVIAVLLLPVIFAGIIPVVLIIIDPRRQPFFWPGLLVLAAGASLLVLCIRDFYKRGGGTLAPWDAPAELVVTGPYRFCRNPMYIGVLLTIAGFALMFTSPLVLLYNIAAAVLFHLRIVKYEEPRLAQQFGNRWALYAAMTNRWLPKIR
ncbi:MAG: isoprenylcysteine carboxylmethyltransferase family protein [Spirochaetales bacterium]|uniref:Isoprenylcysteine carboxylmethyltransferase family protein n=1 Tax=Candidatus Thalassospirochaeta sargassi TaxID=3119039 RepID=A0AAJ1II68_9SPIO|nr:isoprenylcysteine carboxylmethyltransferase family protein [Spirochaetales bacterium]